MSALDRIKAKRELKPCPFCGVIPEYVVMNTTHDFRHVITHPAEAICRALPMVDAPSPELAFKWWNIRHDVKSEAK